jgi:transcriptional regulator with XRE-family HTH domain
MKTLLNLLKESQHLDYRRLNIGEEDLDDTTMTPDEKRAFVEAVASYRKIGEAIYHNGNLMEAYENIKNIVETAEKLTLKETGDWFDKVTVNRHMKSMNESFKIFSSTIKEVSTLQQRLESSYDEIGEVLGKYYEIKEGNEFGAERAKAIASGDDTFNVGGKSFKVTDVDAQDKKNAEEFVGENMSNMKLGSFLKNKKRVNEANDKLMKVGATMVVGGDGSGTVKPVKMKLVSIDYLPKEDKYSYKFQGGGRTQYYTDDVLAKKLKENVNEAKVIVHNEKTGEKHEVLSGKGKGDLLIAMKALQSAAPSHMKYSIKESHKISEDLSAELPKATIPAAIEQRLALAIQKIESGKLNFNQKIQLLAKVVDALNVDKTQLGTLTSKIKSKMESYHTPEEEVSEGNEFGAERAKAIAAGKDSFTVDGKTYKVTDVDPADKKNAEEFANESMKLSTLLKKKSVNEAAARLSDLLKQVANGSTSRIGSTKVDKKTAEKLLKIYNSGDVKMQNKFDGMSIDKVTSAFKPFMENAKLKTEVAPEGWEGTVKAMKDEPGIDNPWALAWWMKGKGYQSHKK